MSVSRFLAPHFWRIALVSFKHGARKSLPPLTAKIFQAQCESIANWKHSTCNAGSLFQREQLLEKVILLPTSFVMQKAWCHSSPNVPLFYARERELNNEILSKNTINDQLEFYQDNKDQTSLVNRITVLHSIAKIAHKYKAEKGVLQREREKARNGQESAYFEILDFISDNISSCKAQGLANIMWALGRTGDKTHPLVQICEEEILSHDFSLFHTSEINQILTGCASLGMKDSKIFERVQESILNEVIRISICEARQINGILLAFAKVGRGSSEFFDHIEYEIIQRDFKNFHNGQIVQFLYTFAMRGVFSDVLFEKAEEEILRRSSVRLRRKEVVMMLWAFATAGKGSKELFETFDKEIVDNRIKDLFTTSLLWIVWSFATRGMNEGKVFKAVAEEIYRRGFPQLTNSEVSLCMYSYALSEIPCQRFLKELAAQVLDRDLAEFQGDQLSQVAWACGKEGVINSELFSRLEQEILKCKFSKNQADMIIEGFCNADMGSEKLFSHLQVMIQQSV